MAVLVGFAAGGRRPAAPDHPAPEQKPTSASGPLAGEDTRSARTSPGTVQIERGRNGHFTVDGAVGGTPLTFIVDTGASEVALSRDDARRVGIWVSDADFTDRAQTASATVRVAHTTLPRVRVGSIELYDINALIVDVPQAMPLLGQSFLSRIERVSIEGNRMTLAKL